MKEPSLIREAENKENSILDKMLQGKLSPPTNDQRSRNSLSPGDHNSSGRGRHSHHSRRPLHNGSM